MISFPLAIFLIPFVVFLFIYLFFLYFNCYHIRVYGVHGFWSHAVVTLFLLGTVLILGGTVIVLSAYDWTTPIRLEKLTNPFSDTSILQPPL